jgi:hypothetical protein
MPHEPSVTIMDNYCRNHNFSGCNYGVNISNVPEEEKDTEFIMYA